MNFGFLQNIPWFKPRLGYLDQSSQNSESKADSQSAITVVEQHKPTARFEIKIWRWSVVSVVPWGRNAGENTPLVKAPLRYHEQQNRVSQFVGDDLGTSGDIATGIVEQREQKPHVDVRLSRWSLDSIIPGIVNIKDSVPWFSDHRVYRGEQNQKSQNVNDDAERAANFASIVVEQERQKPQIDLNLLRRSMELVVPWDVNGKSEVKKPGTINRELKRRARYRRVLDGSSGDVPLRFRPYVSRVPWHTGARAFLSQLFPRYGHYCGPNWSSGRNGGSHIWDRRPIDWLDFCCYCHDIGYDTHDQATLLKADLAFLECLEKPHMSMKGNVQVANIYKTMCITGLRSILIPYRRRLLQLQSGQPVINFGWLSNIKWESWGFQKN